MKTKFTLYNFIFGIVNYIVTIILGLINRKALVYFLGIEYQGLNGLFSNVLSMLSIAELGFGTAIIYHLYHALAASDIDLTKTLMHFYKKCYYAIAFIIAVIGLLIIPFLHYIVGEVDLPLSVSGVYLCFLTDTVVSYLFTYKRSILIANQQNYIVTFCDILYQFVMKTIQIVALITTQDYMLYLYVMIVCRAVENVCINILANRQYSYLRETDIHPLSSEIRCDIKKKVSGAVFHKVGSFVVLGSSNIIITKFLGLVITGIYSNYFLIINTLSSICAQLMTAATASVGHLLSEGDQQHSNEIFDQLFLLNYFLSCLGAVGIFCVATDIIKMIFGADLVLTESVVFVLSINFYQTCMRRTYATFKETAGILYEDRYVPLIESAISIISAVYLVQKIGLSGVFLGTIISSFALFGYTYPILVFKGLLGRKLCEYVFTNAKCFIVTLICMLFAKAVCTHIKNNNLPVVILLNCFVVCIVCILFIYVLIARKSKAFGMLKCRMANMINKHCNYMFKKNF